MFIGNIIQIFIDTIIMVIMNIIIVTIAIIIGIIVMPNYLFGFHFMTCIKLIEIFQTRERITLFLN
jgi:hypothetical protein